MIHQKPPLLRSLTRQRQLLRGKNPQLHQPLFRLHANPCCSVSRRWRRKVCVRCSGSNRWYREVVELGHDRLGGFGPDEGFGADIVLSEISIDGGLQVGDRTEDAAADALPGHFGKEVLDGVEPGGRGRCEVEGPARMARQPGQHPRFREGRLLGCLWVASLSRTTWISLPVRTSRST